MPMQHLNGIHKVVQFWFRNIKNQMRKYVTIRNCGSTQLSWLIQTKCWKWYSHQQKTFPSGRNGRVRDTPAADYTAHGVNTTRCVVYRPPIAVSPFLLALKISPQVPPTLSSRSVGRRWEDMILPGRKDPCNCADPGKSEWEQKLGKIECVFSLYDKMRWKSDAVYLSTPGSPENILRVASCTSVTLVSPFTLRGSLTIYLQAVIELHWRFTWRPWSIEFGDELGRRGRVNSEMHFEAVIEQVWRCNWRPRLSELTASLRGRDRVSLDMQLEATIERDWRSTWRRSIWREGRRQLRFYSFVNSGIER